jgi:hypothetical protein
MIVMVNEGRDCPATRHGADVGGEIATSEVRIVILRAARHGTEGCRHDTFRSRAISWIDLPLTKTRRPGGAIFGGFVGMSSAGPRTGHFYKSIRRL